VARGGDLLAVEVQGDSLFCQRDRHVVPASRHEVVGAVLLLAGDGEPEPAGFRAQLERVGVVAVSEDDAALIEVVKPDLKLNELAGPQLKGAQGHLA
jgi:hypothetical protein